LTPETASGLRPKFSTKPGYHRPRSQLGPDKDVVAFPTRRLVLAFGLAPQWRAMTNDCRGDVDGNDRRNRNLGRGGARSCTSSTRDRRRAAFRRRIESRTGSWLHTASMSAGFDRIRCVGLIAALAAGRAQAEWVVGAYLGASHTVDSALGISQPDGKQSLPGVGWESRSLEAPPYYGLQVAYFFAEGGPLGL